MKFASFAASRASAREADPPSTLRATDEVWMEVKLLAAHHDAGAQREACEALAAGQFKDVVVTKGILLEDSEHISVEFGDTASGQRMPSVRGRRTQGDSRLV